MPEHRYDASEVADAMRNHLDEAWEDGYASGYRAGQAWGRSEGAGVLPNGDCDAWKNGYVQGSTITTDVVLTNATDEQLAAHGLVRLPVDADGVTWRGDEDEPVPHQRVPIPHRMGGHYRP